MTGYYVLTDDGEKAKVDEEEFQEACDIGLAEFNDGVVPTTDKQRLAIIERIQNGE